MISHICLNKGFSHEIFGVAMSLFHYYTYYKSLREFDRIEIAVACVFLACKIEFSFMRMDEAINFYHNLKKNNLKTPDFIKFEIELVSFLGFDINIETPHKYFFQFLEKKNPKFLSDTKIVNLGNKLIGDCYRKNLCIFHSCKYIGFACFYIAFTILDKESDEVISIDEILKLDKEIEKDCFKYCLANIYKNFDSKLNWE